VAYRRTGKLYRKKLPWFPIKRDGENVGGEDATASVKSKACVLLTDRPGVSR